MKNEISNNFKEAFFSYDAENIENLAKEAINKKINPAKMVNLFR